MFGSKKKKVITEKTVEKTKTVSSEKTEVKLVGQVKRVAQVPDNISSVLLRPRITEKATLKAESGVYVFEVSKGASKKDIAEAVKFYYKVSPVKVNITKTPSKRIFSRMSRGQRGVKSGVKKAYVYLKKGDKIEVV